MFGDRDEVMEAWTEASAGKGGADTVPLRRSSGQANGAMAIERSFETGAA
jgi:hypothetical protein